MAPRYISSKPIRKITPADPLTSTDTNDYFGMEFSYEAAAGMGNNAYYDGNASAIKWKGSGAANGMAEQRSYKYTYDQAGRLTNATFQKSTASNWTAEQNTLNENATYDVNGNIQTLTRYQNLRGLSGTTTTSTALAIDNLTYTYAAGNQLNKVEDAASATGFTNGKVNGTDEYTYDTNGSLTKDDNKGISSIVYNLQGKASTINFTDGRKIDYLYDASGNKLKMTTTVGSTVTATDYVNGFVYTNNALSFISSPEGRVVKNGSNYEYQYAIADHQGNTRVVFTSAAPAVDSKTASFETPSAEQANFQNYPTGGKLNNTATNNHTTAGTGSLLLNGGYAGLVGVAKSYRVFPGDKLQIDAWGMYRNLSTSSSSQLTQFAGALLSAFSLSAPVAGETGTASSALNTVGGFEAAGYGDGSSDNTHVRAFVNIMLFDKNYKFVDAAYAQLLATSEGVYVSMSKSYTVKEEGYAYMYVSNEDQRLVDVYFDDVSMKYTPSSVVQYNEYYPFGLQTQNSWTRTNATNNYLYNEASELNNTSSLYDLPYRNYDAVLGRFHQVDPLAHIDHSTSPFSYAGNNPARFNDPNGLLKATQAELFRFIEDAWYGDGGSWSEDGGQILFGSEAEGIQWASDHAEQFKLSGRGRPIYDLKYVGVSLNSATQTIEPIFEKILKGYEAEDESGSKEKGSEEKKDGPDDPPTLTEAWNSYWWNLSDMLGLHNDIHNGPGIIIIGRGNEQFALKKLGEGKYGVWDLNDPKHIMNILNFTTASNILDAGFGAIGVFEEDPRNLYYGSWLPSARIYVWREVPGHPGLYRYLGPNKKFQGKLFKYEYKDGIHTMTPTSIPYP
ncbi:MAG TPA: RHS repeat-associated core domain-containing protein [Ohtaekwangia sp.]|uniref:RHS repeat-associated core domain-containing protein n=1 Tax=Ohtaekwangia sp. TaxID=2066019 RepID=UPI002F94D597